jgi:hypothetical protein
MHDILRRQNAQTQVQLGPFAIPLQGVQDVLHREQAQLNSELVEVEDALASQTLARDGPVVPCLKPPAVATNGAEPETHETYGETLESRFPSHK